MNTNKYFYAVRYLGGNKTCTQGEPNPRTKRLSLAVEPYAFSSRSVRDAWVRDMCWNCSQSGIREKVSKVQLRSMLGGLTDDHFISLVTYLQWNCIDEHKP